MKVNASIKDASRQLEQELAKAIDAIRNDYQSALAEERTLAGALEEQKGAAMDLSRKSVSYTVLEREAQSNRQVYETLLRARKGAAGAGQQPRQQRPAGRPRRDTGRAVHAQPAAQLMLASLAGLALALGLVFVLDYLDDTVKTPEDVTDEAEGSVPGHGAEGVRRRIACCSRPKTPHEFGEAFRSLRTALAFSSSSGRGSSGDGDERAAARGQDDDGVQLAHRAGDRRRAGAADRCRHAAPERGNAPWHRARASGSRTC